MGVNMGLLDRRLRAFIVAPAAVVAAIVIGVGNVVGIVLLAFAAIMLATAAVGICPLYKPFKIDTRSRRSTRVRSE